MSDNHEFVSDVDRWKYDLTMAGWVTESASAWRAPDGSLWRGPFGAWQELQRRNRLDSDSLYADGYNDGFRQGKQARAVAFAAYNQAVEDAKAAIREEARYTDGAASFITAIARKCSPHVYVHRLTRETFGDGHYCRHHPDDPAHGSDCYDYEKFFNDNHI